MPTQIRQIDDLEREITTLRIAGEVLQNDAELIQRIALGSAPIAAGVSSSTLAISHL